MSATVCLKIEEFARPTSGCRRVLFILWLYFLCPDISIIRILKLLFVAYMLSRVAKIVKQLRLQRDHDDARWMADKIIAAIVPQRMVRIRQLRTEVIKNLHKDGQA
jgi:hypothetical protein